MQGVEPWRRPEGAFKTYRDAVGNYEPSGRKKKGRSSCTVPLPLVTNQHGGVSV